MKSKFLKEFKFSHRLERAGVRIEGETDKEYTRRIKNARYGIEGEDRVNYQLMNVELPIVCISDLRVSEEFGSAQADFVIISSRKIIIVEVKNLYGSVKVTKNQEVIRLIPRINFIEEEGMGNPFIQVENQRKVFENLIKQNYSGYQIESLIVMGNPRTAIYFEEDEFPLIRYDYMQQYLAKCIDEKVDDEKYHEMIKLGEFLVSKNKVKDFNDFGVIKKRIINRHSTVELVGEEKELFLELIEERKRISRLKNIPVCNVFNDVDALNLVRFKPITRDEMILIPGIKLRKFLMFGPEVIEIIKKYSKN
ncbi:MAG: NERD domain-containing protein [Bacilli bacterium]